MTGRREEEEGGFRPQFLATHTNALDLVRSDGIRL